MVWLIETRQDWTEEQCQEVLAMLGLDGIDVDTTAPARLADWQPGSKQEGAVEVDA
jgi:hypothetical protein